MVRPKFVLENIIPKLEGGAKQSSEFIIRQELVDWLTALIQIHQHLNIHYDYHGDLIILDLLLSNYTLKNNITCITHDFSHLASESRTNHQTTAHHALFDAQALLNRWQNA